MLAAVASGPSRWAGSYLLIDKHPHQALAARLVTDEELISDRLFGDSVLWYAHR